MDNDQNEGPGKKKRSLRRSSRSRQRNETTSSLSPARKKRSQNQQENGNSNPPSSDTATSTVPEETNNGAVTPSPTSEATVDTHPQDNHSTKKAPKKGRGTSKTPREKEDDIVKEFSMSWICCECKEADCLMIPTEYAEQGHDALMICEGDCRRLFHYICAGLARMPTKAESYVCKDCQTQRFACAICQTYGSAGIDVFKCQEKKCGLFFHEACLNMQDIPFELVEEEEQLATDDDKNKTGEKQNQQAHNGGENDVEMTDTNEKPNAAASQSDAKQNGVHSKPENDSHSKETTKTTTTTTTTTLINPETGDLESNAKQVRRVFTCPAHTCWCCSQEDMAKKHSAMLKNERVAAKSTKKKRGKRAAAPKKSGAFESRKDDVLMRCLVCPRAYHVPCIPPSARFHELAMLCHEHAFSFRLPELVKEDSIQGGIEAAIDKKFDQRTKKETTIARAKGRNKFFGGLKGNSLTTSEQELAQELRNDNDDDEDENRTVGFKNLLPFCLPCEIKDDVHSKPQAYRHVHALKYDPNNRPSRIPHSGDVCQCDGFCGDDCLNRMLYTECVGEKGARNSNCAVGKGCGNRRLAKRQFAKCKPMREKGRGWGLVTCSKVLKGDLVTEYVGEVIDAKTKEKRLSEWAKEHPNDPNFYVMSLSQQWFIDAREVANLSRFINHSCAPNCSLTSVNVDGYMRNGIYALRDIEEGEFLSYDYRFDTRKENQEKFICRCGAPSCRGTMKNIQLEKGEESESKKLAWIKAKKNFDKDLAFLDQFDKQQVKSNVDSMVPASSKADEQVASGPQPRYRAEAMQSRLFLWRNASQVGADFERRLGKLDQSEK